MEVVEHERSGSDATPPQETGHRLEQPEAGALRLEGRGLGKVGEPVAQLGEELRQLRPPGASVGPQRVGVDAAHVRAQRLDPGPVGGRPTGLPAAPDEHAGVAALGGATSSSASRLLPIPGSPADEHDRAAAGERLVQRRGQLASSPCGRRTRARRRVAASGATARSSAGSWREDRRVELAQLAAGLDAELLDERAPRLPVGLEGLGLAAAAVEARA